MVLWYQIWNLNVHISRVFLVKRIFCCFFFFVKYAIHLLFANINLLHVLRFFDTSTCRRSLSKGFVVADSNGVSVWQGTDARPRTNFAFWMRVQTACVILDNFGVNGSTGWKTARWAEQTVYDVYMYMYSCIIRCLSVYFKPCRRIYLFIYYWYYIEMV